ncbi:MAG: hypothetical protein ABIH46_08390 [Chloroflexota bacterium]
MSLRQAYGAIFGSMYERDRRLLEQQWRWMQQGAAYSLFRYAYAATNRHGGDATGAYRAFYRAARKDIREFRKAIVQEIESSGYANLGAQMARVLAQEAGHPVQPVALPVPKIDEEWTGYLQKAEAKAVARLAVVQGAPQIVTTGLDALVKAGDHLIGVARDWSRDQLWIGTSAQISPPYWLRNFRESRVTCLACIMLGGTIYTPEQARGWRDHPHGQCWLSPTWINESTIDGEKWFLGLDDKTQREMMGEEFWEAWKRGEFALGDLVKFVSEGYAIQNTLQSAIKEGMEGEEGM